MTKSNLEREGFIGLILPGYTPSLSGVRARTEVEQENIICCLVPSGLLSSHSVWPGPLCLGPAPPSSLVPTSGKSSNQESAPQTCPRAKLMKAILAVRCPHPRWLSDVPSWWWKLTSTPMMVLFTSGGTARNPVSFQCVHRVSLLRFVLWNEPACWPPSFPQPLSSLRDSTAPGSIQ